MTIVFFFSDHDYLGYNGEPFTVLLITMALFLLYRIFSIDFQLSRLSEFALGIVLVAIPFSKFQGGPIAFAIGLYYVIYLLVNKKKHCSNSHRSSSLSVWGDFFSCHNRFILRFLAILYS